MSDDLGNKIKQITDALGQEKLQENIMSLLSLLSSSMNTGNPPSKGKEESGTIRESKNEGAVPDNNIEMLNMVRKVMERLNSTNDPRISLLTALKPFMGARRQKKINNCINILRMSSLVRLMEEQEKGVF